MVFTVKMLLPFGRSFQRIVRRSYSSCKAISSCLTQVNPFGTLVLNCPDVSTTIRPVNPFEVPDGNEARIKITPVDDDRNALPGGLNEYISIDYVGGDKSVLSLQQMDSVQNVAFSLDVEIPHNYDINVTVLRLDLKETEGDTLIVSSEGDCTLGKIKSDNVNIEVRNGELSCKSLLGSGDIFARNGLKFTKIQSKHLNLECESDIELSSVYCQQLKCFTSSGRVQLGDMHGYSDLQTDSGLISVSALDGDTNIQTTSGDVSATIEACRNVFVASEQGNINVGLSDHVSAFIEAEGSFVDVPEDLLIDGMKREASSGLHFFEGKLGNADSAILVKTQHGTVSFSRKNWFSRFNTDLS